MTMNERTPAVAEPLTPLEQKLDEMLCVRRNQGGLTQQDIALVWEALDAARAVAALHHEAGTTKYGGACPIGYCRATEICPHEDTRRG